MKKIIYFILFITNFLYINNTYSNNSFNNDSYIQKTHLVENYIINHKKKINLFIKKYNIKDNKIINKKLEELDKLNIVINKIQDNQSTQKESQLIMSSIIKKLKEINNELKVALKKEKKRKDEQLLNKKKIYSKLGNKLSQKINSITLMVAKKVSKDKKNTDTDLKKIKKNIIQLKKQSKKLENIGNINFNSEEELKIGFIRILKNIKREMSLMKKNLKK